MSRKRKKKKTGIRLFENIIIIILLGIMIFSGFKIVCWFIDNEKNKHNMEKVSKAVSVNSETKPGEKISEEDKYNVDFKTLKEINNDVVAWVKVYGVDIEFPVVQANDNDYYLNHSIDNSINGAGWIYADFRNKVDGTDKNLIIYGHNRRDGSMFEPLKEMLEEDWYNNTENKQILLITEKGKYMYDIFSVYKIEAEVYYTQTDFDSNFDEFINTIKNRSIIDFNIKTSKDSNIITLSTCDNNSKYRVVIHGVLSNKSKIDNKDSLL